MKIGTPNPAGDTIAPQQSAYNGVAFDSTLRGLERDMWHGAASGCRPRDTHASHVAATHSTAPDGALAPGAGPLRTGAISDHTFSNGMARHGTCLGEAARSTTPIRPSAYENSNRCPFEPSSAWKPDAPLFPKVPRLSDFDAEQTSRPDKPLAPRTIDSPDLRITLLQGASGISLAIRVTSETTDTATALAQHALDTVRRQGGGKPVRLIVNGFEHAQIDHRSITLDGEHHGD